MRLSDDETDSEVEKNDDEGSSPQQVFLQLYVQFALHYTDLGKYLRTCEFVCFSN